jgi:murein DD-endopeptidase MepM/ murein hydrolase activator NlpD
MVRSSWFKHLKQGWSRSALSLLVFVGMPGLAAPAKSLTHAGDVKWQPPKIVNGSPVLFQLSAPVRVQSISATWFGHQLNFFRSGNSWYALAGVPVETVPGTYELRLTETFVGGKTLAVTRKVKVASAIYPKITVKVAKQYTEPNPEQLRDINTDKELKQKVFATETPQRMWAGPFAAPVTAAISDVFGTARVFNQEVQSRHLGLDYGVPAGTPVHAVNRGTVILARPLYFEGSCVVIDHGQGLFSLYLHLSDFKVKEGDQVETGQEIGLSGGSGRATGPHLHLAIRWQGVYLNPALLLELKIPVPTSASKLVPFS